MAMTAGTVTIDGSGNPSGGGMARAFYDAMVVEYHTGVTFGSTEGLVAARGQLARFANLLAGVIVPHIVSNAEVTVTVSTSDSGLQRTPDPNNPNTNTQGPSATKTLATKGTVA